jgi:hypothetical protein
VGEPLTTEFADARAGTVSAAALRGVYVWAGDATVELQREKFPDVAIDVCAHREAHTATAARSLARCGVNFAFLSMNWGFPPEIEAPFWLQFEEAAALYQAEGMRAIAYVQASNCVAKGSYAARGWYARTPTGRTIPYFRNRLMTCWNDAEWTAEVADHARRAIRAGADGVFFDNLWMGATPWLLGHEPGGFAGCWCDRCQTAFRAACGFDMPRRITPGQPVTRMLLDWRAAIVQRRLAEWSRVIRSIQPDAWVLANNCDVMLRPTADLFGLEPGTLAASQTALLVENIAMPKLDASANTLVGNALTLRALRAIAPQRPLLSVTYERGIGLDRSPPATAIVRAVAETAALGACPILKGSEYLDAEGRFTVLTSAALAETRRAVAPLLCWLERNSSLYEGAWPDPDVLVLYDADAFRNDFTRAATATFGVAVALVAEGIPFDFVTRAAIDSEGEDRPVLIPPGVRTPFPVQRPIDVELEDLHPIRLPGRFTRNRLAHRAVDPFLSSFSRGYFGNARIRRFVDSTGLTARFLRSPFFRLPADPARISKRLPEIRPVPRASSPVLLERRARPDGAFLFHLVNYVDTPAQVRLPVLPQPPMLHSPDANTGFDRDNPHMVWLECYAVLEYPPAARGAD